MQVVPKITVTRLLTETSTKNSFSLHLPSLGLETSAYFPELDFFTDPDKDQVFCRWLEKNKKRTPTFSS